MKLARLIHTPMIAVFLAFTASSQNMALQCGAGTRLVFPHHAIMNTLDAVTIEGWVRADPASVAGKLLFHRYEPGVEHKMISIDANGGIEFVYAGSPWNVPHAPPGSFPVDGEWHHVAFVRHPTGAWKLFVDGSLIQSGGPATSFGNGCWLTCQVINGTPPTVLETTPDGDGWSIDEWRVSAVDRYAGAFVPARYWLPDPQTVMLLGFDQAPGSVVHDSAAGLQTGSLSAPFAWVAGLPHPSPFPFQSDDFSGPALDTVIWSAITNGIPYASATQANGVLTLANKAYLRTNEQVDPVSVGGVRVRGLWRFDTVNPEAGVLAVLTRTTAQPDPMHYYEATSGLEFNLWLGPSYPGVAVIQPRGTSILTGSPTVSGSLLWSQGAWYEFEALDAVDQARWTITEVGQPSNSITVSCSVSSSHEPVNFIAVHGREYIGGPNVCALDEISLEVPDCNSNQVADPVDLSAGFSADCDGDLDPDECQIQADPSLDLNANGILDPCECLSSNYCVAAPNSVGPGGQIGHAGSMSVALNDLTLLCSGLPPNCAGVFFYGNNMTSVPFGNGVRCVGGSAVTRTQAVVASPSGIAARWLDYSSLPVTGQISAGMTRFFQFWYRNPAAGGAGFNLSNGLSVRFCP